MSEMQFAAALDGARTLALIDEIARELWRAYGAGALDDNEAGRVSERIEAARQRLRPQKPGPVAPPAPVARLLRRRRRPVSPDREKSRARRRRLAYSGALPPALAGGFTVSQLAVLCGLLTSRERRRPGDRNLPNLVKIASREWRSWIGRGRRRGSKKSDPQIGTIFQSGHKWKQTASRTRKPQLRAVEAMPPLACLKRI